MQLHLKIETDLRLIAKKTEKTNIFHNINKSKSISGGSDFLGHKRFKIPFSLFHTVSQQSNSELNIGSIHKNPETYD